MEDTLDNVISEARKLIEEEKYKQCKKLIEEKMGEYPDNPIPHNLMGILYERKQDHIGAMKHFRAAWALDPSYRPALQNLDSFGSLFADKVFVFEERDEQSEISRGDRAISLVRKGEDK